MRPRASILVGCFWALLLGACDSTERTPIQLEVGRAEDERHSFVPAAAFAEYVELPGERHELTLTLASYRASCSEFVPPGAGQTLVTVLVTAPINEPLGPASYPSGAPSARPGASPTVRLGSRAYELSPGGALALSEVDLQPQGVVAGRLNFEFAGTADKPAQRLEGRFRARICRFSRARAP